MANIDNFYRIEGLSLNDDTLLTGGNIDPTVDGYEAPLGSLYQRNGTTVGNLYLKVGTADTEWQNLGTTHAHSNQEDTLNHLGVDADGNLTFDGVKVDTDTTADLSEYRKSLDQDAIDTAQNAVIATKVNADAVYTKNDIDASQAAQDALIATKANSADVYTKAENDASQAAQDALIATKANSVDVYTKAQIDDSQAAQNTAIDNNTASLANLATLIAGDNDVAGVTWDEATRTMTITMEDATTSTFVIGDEMLELVNDLNSTDTSKALTAAQGKVLKTLIDLINDTFVRNVTWNEDDRNLAITVGDAITLLNIKKTEVVDDLISNDIDKALSANQGTVLQTQIDNRLKTNMPDGQWQSVKGRVIFDHSTNPAFNIGVMGASGLITLNRNNGQNVYLDYGSLKFSNPYGKNANITMTTGTTAGLTVGGNVSFGPHPNQLDAHYGNLQNWSFVTREYVQSSSHCTISNGSGELKNGYNWNVGEYSQKAPEGFNGSLKISNSAYIVTDELIPLNGRTSLTTGVSIKLETTDGSSARTYAGLVYYDRDKKSIQSQYVSRAGNIILTQDIAAGDTEIHFDPATSTIREYGTGGIIFLGEYSDSNGRPYLVYSRLRETGLWDNAGVDRVNGVITLTSPITTTSRLVGRLAGAELHQYGASHGSYHYCIYSNNMLTDADGWVSNSITLNSQFTKPIEWGESTSNKMWPDVAYVTPLLLLNYGNNDNTQTSYWTGSCIDFAGGKADTQHQLLDSKIEDRVKKSGDIMSGLLDIRPLDKNTGLYLRATANDPTNIHMTFKDADNLSQMYVGWYQNASQVVGQQSDLLLRSTVDNNLTVQSGNQLTIQTLQPNNTTRLSWNGSSFTDYENWSTPETVLPKQLIEGMISTANAVQDVAIAANTASIANISGGWLNTFTQNDDQRMGCVKAATGESTIQKPYQFENVNPTYRSRFKADMLGFYTVAGNVGTLKIEPLETHHFIDYSIKGLTANLQPMNQSLTYSNVNVQVNATDLTRYNNDMVDGSFVTKKHLDIETSVNASAIANLANLISGDNDVAGVTWDEATRTMTITKEDATTSTFTIGDEMLALVDNLTTDDSSKALTAKQGKILKALIDSAIEDAVTSVTWDESSRELSVFKVANAYKLDISKTEVVDNLTSTDTDKALSANQGNILNLRVDDRVKKTGDIMSGNLTVKTDGNSVLIQPATTDGDAWYRVGRFDGTAAGWFGYSKTQPNSLRLVSNADIDITTPSDASTVFMRTSHVKQTAKIANGKCWYGHYNSDDTLTGWTGISSSIYDMNFWVSSDSPNGKLMLRSKYQNVKLQTEKTGCVTEISWSNHALTDYIAWSSKVTVMPKEYIDINDYDIDAATGQKLPLPHERTYISSKVHSNVANGSGEFGNAYNWPGTTYDVLDDMPEGTQGAFKRVGYGNIISQDLLRLTNGYAKIKFWMKTESTDGGHPMEYAGFNCIDYDGHHIGNNHVAHVGTVNLSQPVVAGDTVIHFDPNSGTGLTKTDIDFQNGFAFFGEYRDSAGKLYQNYTRFHETNLWDDGDTAIDMVAGTITLRDPLAAESRLVGKVAGDQIWQSTSGGTYLYPALTSEFIDPALGWKRYEGEISGRSNLTTHRDNTFQIRAGTVYIKPMFLLNYDNQSAPKTDTTWFTGVEVELCKKHHHNNLPDIAEVATTTTGDTLVYRGNEYQKKPLVFDGAFNVADGSRMVKTWSNLTMVQAARNDENFVTINADGTLAISGEFDLIEISFVKRFGGGRWSTAWGRVVEVNKDWVICSDNKLNSSYNNGNYKGGYPTSTMSVSAKDVQPGVNPIYKIQMKADTNNHRFKFWDSDTEWTEEHVSIIAYGKK